MRLFKTHPLPTVLIRMAVGLIFLSEGIQKFIRPAEVGAGRFAKIGFENPVFWSYLTGAFEIFCSLLVLAGFLVRLSVIPLIIIMITAFVTTKWPVLMEKGFWSMAHEYRTDFAMTLLLIYLLRYGAGNYSLDLKINRSKMNHENKTAGTIP
ncbi:MAG TPA: DoxX family protein [Niabella sp.]|nr:DoxX family protein [Niabella sp.]